MNKKMYFLLLFIPFITITGCTDSEPTAQGKWYTESQVTIGEKLYLNNCAACHGSNAQGTFNWKKPLVDGSYPPPPLNGRAHTWHHPMAILKRTIRNGGIPIGGKMPPFKDKLSDEEIEAVIAFFQSKWSPKIYADWKKRSGL